ncbi:MAG TPA: hypothetical protein VFQ65_01390 [Kofleriaceae bacterium]|nr:hypothetical protein [Kofleriaceae bacterium]
MLRALAIALVACNSSPSPKDNGTAVPECPGSGCKDAPVIPGASVLFSGGFGPPAKVLVAGDAVVFEDPTCCIYVTPRSGGPTTTVVKRTQIADFAISKNQIIYVGVLENAQRMTVAGVALPGHEGTKVMPPQLVPGDFDRAKIAVTNDDVYVVAQTLQASSLLHWSVDGNHASNVSGGGSLVTDATHAYLVQGTAVHSLDHDGNTGPTLGDLPDALPERFALDGDTLYYTTYRSIESAHLQGTSLKRDAWSADAKIVDSIAAANGRVVWGEGHTIYTAHPAKATVIETPGDEIVGLALAHDHVIWSVPYTYGPNATTTDERLKTQKTGFVATAPLPK